MTGKRPAVAAAQSLLPLTSYLLLVTGCHSSPAQKQQQARQELASWEATAQLTHQLSVRNALPQVYVRQVSEAVEQGREEARKKGAEGPR